jgi:hypothetical protein
MSPKTTFPTHPPKEKAFLVGVDIKHQPSNVTLEDSLAEWLAFQILPVSKL